ncbi:MAG: DMT family transporter [Gammaproteobacteria bacterium]
MQLVLAYFGVVLIWSTTPLAIKWSSLDAGFVFGVTARMSIGAICLLLLMLVKRQPLRLNKIAWLTYLAVALQLYASMMMTYWGAQFIPSGWLSLIFGLNPFMTAILAAIFLNERSLGWGKVFSYTLGLGGLYLMFHSALDINRQAAIGMTAALIATFLHAASAVWVKRLHSGLPALTQISGGMLIALPAYLATWYWLDQGVLPKALSIPALYSILYLGLIATPIGFAMYYYVLSHLTATSVALITLITPVFSLILGHSVNQEPMTLKIAIGTSLILTALAMHTMLNRRQYRQLEKAVQAS